MVFLMSVLKIVVFVPLDRLGTKQLKLAKPVPTLCAQNAISILVAAASNVVMVTL